jgi:hypothetical protein
VAAERVKRGSPRDSCAACSEAIGLRRVGVLHLVDDEPLSLLARVCEPMGVLGGQPDDSRLAPSPVEARLRHIRKKKDGASPKPRSTSAQGCIATEQRSPPLARRLTNLTYANVVATLVLMAEAPQLQVARAPSERIASREQPARRSGDFWLALRRRRSDP